MAEKGKQMMRGLIRRGWLPAVLGLILLTSCGPSRPEHLPLESEVSAYTGGLLSRFDPVRILFTSDKTETLRQELVASHAAVLEPRVDGQWNWDDGRTLVFRPSVPLAAGTRYLVRFQPKTTDLHAFEFAFQTLSQRVGVKVDPLSSTRDVGAMDLTGTFETVDRAETALVERSVQVTFDGKNETVRWDHDADGFTHRFKVVGLVKGAKDRQVSVQWNGDRVGAPDHGSINMVLPAAGTFSLLSANPAPGNDRQIDLTFSEPVKPSQNLEGLVTVEGATDLRYSVRGNQVSVYAPAAWVGPQKLAVSPGILSIAEHPIREVAAQTVTFNHPLPSVKFVGTGAILPTTQNQTVPIETTNVDSVMVEALQVYDDNVLQFFQVNNHVGRTQLARVGKVIWRDVVSLDFKPEDQDKTVRRGLDLSPLLKKNPAGFIVLKVSIRRQNMRLDGHVGRVEFRDDPVNWDPAFTPDDQEQSYWDYWDEESGEQMYKDRDNPLTVSYYMPRWNHPIQDWRNVMVSDLGLLAKAGEDGALTLAASDLKTALPKPGVALTVYDFQRRELWKGATDAAGQISAKLDPNNTVPAFVVAQADGQMGYLRLDTSLQLAVSSFDIGGTKLEKGINGYIYGERGVWRPGDPLYLTFVLEDPAKSLPLNYPVVFELRNPQGELADKQVKTLGVNGMYTFRTSTTADAPTGVWSGRVSVAGKTFQKDLRVETIMPNRLKIDLQWKNGATTLTSGTWQGTLSSRWLIGTPASGLKAETKVTFSSVSTSFDRWNNYVFDDPLKKFTPHTDSVFDGDLDDKGNGSVSADFAAQNTSPGRLQAAFNTKVYEPSGVFSSSTKVVPFDPYSQYVGLQLPKGDAVRGMLLVDTDHTAKIVLVDPSGNPVPSGRVKMSLIKLNWRWWWEQGDDANAEYVSESEFRTVSEGTVDVKNGAAEWKFRLAYPEWGRFMVRAEDSRGHSTGKIVYIDWPGWAGRSKGEGGGGANLLTLTTDKTKYQVGDTVSVTFPSQPQGRAWVTLEAGGKVAKSEWVTPAAGATTTYQFTATPEMAPNIYVHVTFVQPHQQTANDLPIRVYGIVPVAVEDPASRIQPVIVSDASFAPLTKAKIVVKEATGRPMTYTLAIVDEGLLGITNFETPDPWKTFYSRRASLLKSWDLYDYVSGAWTGSLQNILAIGGDGDLADNSKVKVNRFPPMVRFIDPTVLAAGETKTHYIDIPSYVGEVRIMAVAAYKRTYGLAERSVTVKSPVMALPTLPRVLSPGENFAMPISIFAYNGQDQVDVAVATSGAVRVAGDATKTVSTKGGTEVLTSFPMTTNAGTGPAKVTVTVTAGKDVATQVIDLEVRMPSAPLTKEVVGPVLKPGETWTATAAAFGYPGTAKATLEVSQLRPLDLERRLAYLIQYPHGCIEQTTSSVFPQLYLPAVIALGTDRKAQIQANVEAGIQRLKQFQTLSGGFSYWPGQSDTNLWGTNYAGHFLVEAKKAGYAVPQDLLTRWLAFEKSAVSSWNESPQDSAYDQAYRLYVIGVAGSPDLGAMNRLKEKALPAPAAFLLAAAYNAVGQTSMASTLINRGGTVASHASDNWEETFGSDTRDRAIELMVAVDLQDNARAGSLFDSVAKDLNQVDWWMSTQTTSWALSACARYLGWQLPGTTGKVEIVWGSGTSTTATFPQAAYSRTQPLADQAAEPIKVTNTGTAPVTPRLFVTANPKPGEESGGKAGLGLQVSYDADQGSFDRLPLGTEVSASIRVTNNTRVAQNRLALSYLAPSGWELQNPRLTLETNTAPADYQDFRDDRILTYFSLKPGESKEFPVKATATYQGKFYLPMVQVEAMYDGTVYARNPGTWVSVQPPAPGSGPR
jgi:uncharacterized protein YfaS (alpha-2-macroglobulin family)